MHPGPQPPQIPRPDSQHLAWACCVCAHILTLQNGYSTTHTCIQVHSRGFPHSAHAHFFRHLGRVRENAGFTVIAHEPLRGTSSATTTTSTRSADVRSSIQFLFNWNMPRVRLCRTIAHAVLSRAERVSCGRTARHRLERARRERATHQPHPIWRQIWVSRRRTPSGRVCKTIWPHPSRSSSPPTAATYSDRTRSRSRVSACACAVFLHVFALGTRALVRNANNGLFNGTFYGSFNEQWSRFLHACVSACRRSACVK